MYKRLYSYLECDSVLYPLQFGFRRKYLTNHALLSITESIRYSIDNNEFGCVVFIDLKKAFDTVNHSILLLKLHHYGIRSVAYDWFQSYLSNRQQFVCANGNDSNHLSITCGVPQESVLGPCYFYYILMTYLMPQNHLLFTYLLMILNLSLIMSSVQLLSGWNPTDWHLVL